jgi:uncharacterized membrane protein YhaH (DUF805 family)
MDFGYLFTSFEGRINRKPFWMGVIVMIVAAIVLTVVLGLIVGWEGRGFAIVALLIQLAMLYPSLALMIKRLHDRDRPDYFAYIMIAPAILSSVTNVLGLTGNPAAPNALDYLLSLIVFVIGIWSLIELGILRGTVGPNRHGPDPLEGASELRRS